MDVVWMPRGVSVCLRFPEVKMKGAGKRYYRAQHEGINERTALVEEVSPVLMQELCTIAEREREREGGREREKERISHVLANTNSSCVFPLA